MEGWKLIKVKDNCVGGQQFNTNINSHSFNVMTCRDKYTCAWYQFISNGYEIWYILNGLFPAFGTSEINQ